MFGYIVLSSDAPKEDRRIYREAYCGLCHVLREKYGKTGALSLSYDMTFLSLLLSDIEDDTPIEGKERCIVHPITEHKFFTTKVMEYTAAMQILLSHYALIDSNNDEGRNKKDRFLPFIPEIEKTYKRQCDTLKNKLSALWENEKKGIKDPEMNALYFGEALGEIFVKDENSHFAPDLRRMGCGMGRYIYLLDAWDAANSAARTTRRRTRRKIDIILSHLPLRKKRSRQCSLMPPPVQHPLWSTCLLMIMYRCLKISCTMACGAGLR